VKHAALVVQREAETTFAQYDARFGLNPPDRMQLKIGAAAATSPAGAERLLS
jgi:hypothetical protein